MLNNRDNELLVESAHRRHNMIDSILAFGRCLRREGINTTPAHLQNTFAGLDLIDIGEKAEFKTLLRCTMIADVNALAIFDRLFQGFWESSPSPEPISTETFEDEPVEGDPPGEEFEGRVNEDAQMPVGDDETEDGGQEIRKAMASDGVAEARKNYSQLNPEELARVEALVQRLAMRLGDRLGRRLKQSRHAATIDFRRSMRGVVRYGGEVIDLKWRRPKTKPVNIHLVLDVSGSMDVYNRMFFTFMYGLQRTLKKAHSYVFSTHLSHVTHLLKGATFSDAWKNLQANAVNWSGGTHIGSSLMTLYARHIKSVSARRTVVIVVSDGWDRGEPHELQQAMRLIHRSSRHLFWLNPLLAVPDYQPICQGMATALPHIDTFLALENLNSIERLCQQIESAL